VKPGFRATMADLTVPAVTTMVIKAAS